MKIEINTAYTVGDLIAVKCGSEIKIGVITAIRSVIRSTSNESEYVVSLGYNKCTYEFEDKDVIGVVPGKLGSACRAHLEGEDE